MSKLETAMNNIAEVFNFYASKDGDRFKLSRFEVKNLLQEELSMYQKASRDPRMFEMIMNELDNDSDGSVSFEEFVAIVARLIVSSSIFFKGYTPQVPRCGVP